MKEGNIKNMGISYYSLRILDFDRFSSSWFVWREGYTLKINAEGKPIINFFEFSKQLRNIKDRVLTRYLPGQESNAKKEG